MLVTQHFAKDLYKDKTVFVTGGGSGINLGVAKNFAALGANIAICGRTQEKLDAAAVELRALGAKVCPVAADVRDIAALDAAFARSHAELGPMDVLVCGAAGNFLAPAEKLSANGFKTVIDIDLPRPRRRSDLLLDPRYQKYVVDIERMIDDTSEEVLRP